MKHDYLIILLPVDGEPTIDSYLIDFALKNYQNYLTDLGQFIFNQIGDQFRSFSFKSTPRAKLVAIPVINGREPIVTVSYFCHTTGETSQTVDEIACSSMADRLKGFKFLRGTAQLKATINLVRVTGLDAELELVNTFAIVKDSQAWTESLAIATGRVRRKPKLTLVK